MDAKEEISCHTDALLVDSFGKENNKMYGLAVIIVILDAGVQSDAQKP
jgi:hypothetical protein